jgi:hypothetical protein
MALDPTLVEPIISKAQDLQWLSPVLRNPPCLAGAILLLAAKAEDLAEKGCHRDVAESLVSAAEESISHSKFPVEDVVKGAAQFDPKGSILLSFGRSRRPGTSLPMDSFGLKGLTGRRTSETGSTYSLVRK